METRDVAGDDLPRIEFDPELSALIAELNSQARGVAAAAEPMPALAVPERPSPPPAMTDLLAGAVRRRASDVLLACGSTPVLRVDGRLVREAGTPLGPEDLREILLPLLGRKSRDALVTRRFADFAFDVPGVGRFRANVHFERGRLAACLRSLPAVVPDLGELGLPAPVARLCEHGAGLVLVVGPAGSGKTTTLAALLSRLLRLRAVHAITIEEPIEYVHEHQGSLVEQVEVPVDSPSFAEALRSALRQSPDVLLVGEMRDSDTMAAALTAAETGHLVLASVHAYTAPQAVHRVVDAFAAAQQEQVRRQLAATLAAILAQRLLPGSSGRRVVATELMVANDAVRHLVREGRIHQLAQAFASAEGSHTLEASLAALVGRGTIDAALAERHAYHPEELRRRLG